MANRRMMSKDVQGTDRFYDLSEQARILYDQLCLFADDDGFSDNYKSVMKTNCSPRAALDELIDRGYILSFEKDGVIVIAHWKLMNTIQADRYHCTKYRAIKDTLEFDADGAYKIPKAIEASRMDTECIQTVSNMETQSSVVKPIVKEDSGNILSRQPQPPSTIPFYSKDGVVLSEDEYNDIKQYKDWDKLLDKQAQGKKADPPWRGKRGSDYEEIKYWIMQDSVQKISCAEVVPKKVKPNISDADAAKLRKEAQPKGIDIDETLISMGITNLNAPSTPGAFDAVRKRLFTREVYTN